MLCAEDELKVLLLPPLWLLVLRLLLLLLHSNSANNPTCYTKSTAAEDELNFLLLRQRAAAYMRAHADHFKPFVLEASRAVLCCAALCPAGTGVFLHHLLHACFITRRALVPN